MGGKGRIRRGGEGEGEGERGEEGERVGREGEEKRKGKWEGCEGARKVVCPRAHTGSRQAWLACWYWRASYILHRSTGGVTDYTVVT